MKKFNKKIPLLFASFALMMGVAVTNADSKVTKAAAGDTYEKVTTDTIDTNSEYLLAYVNEASAKVFNGADAAADYVSATINNDKIVAETGMAVIKFESTSTTGTYAVKIDSGAANSGKYIEGKSGSNSIQFKASSTGAQITWSADHSIIITSNSTSFRFNKATTNGDRFRFYKTATTGTDYVYPALFKLVTDLDTNTPSISITEKPSDSMRVGETFDLVAETKNADDAIVEWSVDNDDVASITTSGHLEALSVGTFVATAKITVNGEDYTASTNPIKVKDVLVLDHAGTEEDPLSVADAIKVCVDAGNANTTESYYVKGIVTNIVEISPSYGNATMDIADTADGVDVLRLYRIYYLGGAKFTAEDQVAVGDTVVCYGKLINYGNKTPEMPTGSQLTEHTVPSEEVDPQVEAEAFLTDWYALRDEEGSI
ncbi:MAG: Ig-like domain-containing protein, partial [Erysipelotrichales bacterium]|nr:Ig-like domain-containing protein [Erysipelotrichales bacterium]